MTAHRFLGDTDGSALVEGAVLLPFLLLFVLGIYEFSWFFYQQHLASTGVRDAARYLARLADPCAQSREGAGAQQRARNLAATGSIGGGPSRIKGWTPAMVTARCTAIENPSEDAGMSAYRGGGVILVVTVSTRFTDPSLGFFGFLGLRPPLISVSHSERAIGPG
jgi:Flp pilus assembly protein TadG